MPSASGYVPSLYGIDPDRARDLRGLSNDDLVRSFNNPLDNGKVQITEDGRIFNGHHELRSCKDELRLARSRRMCTLSTRSTDQGVETVLNSGIGESSEPDSPFRSAREVGDDEQIREIRVADHDDLVAIWNEASRHRWGAKWTSMQAMNRQVDFVARPLLIPTFWNGGIESEPESLRCHIWFKEAQAPHLGRVSVIDVSLSKFRELTPLSQDKSAGVLLAVILHAPLSEID